MQIEINTKEFLNALKKVAVVINKKTSQPIITYVHINTEGNEIKLTGTNLIQTLIINCPATINKSGTIVVPALILHKILSKVKVENILITSKDRNIILQAGKQVFNLFGIAPEEYPTFSSPTPELFVSLPENEFNQMIKKVKPTLGISDESKYILNSCELTIFNNYIQLVSVDSFQANIITRKVEVKNINKFPETHFLIPRKAILILEKILKTGELKIMISKKSISFQTDKMLLSSRLMEGIFPQMKSVLPKSTPENKFSLNRDQVINALDSTSLILNKDNKMSLELTNNHLILSACNPLLGDSKVTFNINCSQKVALEFNWKYLLTSLKTNKDEIIMLEVHEDMIIITNVENNYLYLLMVVRGKNEEFQEVA